MKHGSKIESAEEKPAMNASGWVYALPGVLLCLAALAMLVMDVVSAGMVEKQYVYYPVICRAVMVISTVAMLSQTVLHGPDFFRKPDLTAMLFAGFALCMVISTCFNGFSKEALFSVPYRYVGVVDLMVFMAVYMGCSKRVGSKTLRHIILLCFMLTADLVCGVFLYDWFVSDIPAIGSENVVSAIFYHDNHYGYFLVIAIMISAGYFIYGSIAAAAAGLLSLGLNLLALAVNRTAGCFIAVGAAIVIMIIYTFIFQKNYFKRAAILAAAFIAGAVFLVAASEALRDDLVLLMKEVFEILRGGDTTFAGHGRWQLWKITADYISDEPLCGYGCEGIRDILYDYTEISSPHNEPLTYAAFFGIPAAVLYTAGCLSAIISGLRRRSSVDSQDKQEHSRVIAAFAALGYLISSLFGVAMFYTVPYLFIFMGLAASFDSKP
jgi:O-antigen ligase